jgi:hypothetical protein
MEEKTLQKLETIIERAEALMDNLIDGRIIVYGNDHEILSDKEIFTDVNSQSTVSNLELEARLGHWNVDEKCFQPGVTRFFMERALNMLNSFDSWSRVTNWSEMQDFYYENKSGQKMRTTIYYDDQNKQIRKHHIIKKVIDQENIIVKGSENPDIRISLAVEHEIDEEFVPEVVEPNFVRIKQRKSFFYTSLGFSDANWIFDMTLSWSGKTKSIAEQKQQNECPIYEIECECLAPLAYRLHKQEKRSFVARSLLLKLLDFYYPPTFPQSSPNAETLFETLTIAR